MLRFSSFLVSAAALLVTADAARSADRATYQVLDEGAAQLRDDFNAAKGSVRVLFVVDPICPGCLRGLDDMNKDLLSKANDPRLQTFVVHVPRMTPPPKAKDVPEAATLLHNDHVHHYWNPSGSFGEELSEGLGLKVDGEDVYAWDVWLVYGPDAVWDGTSPPKPEYFMHQLWALGVTDLPRFDSKVFAQRVHQLLASVASASVMSNAASLATVSRLTCPVCGHVSVETMPTNACVYFFECVGCGTLLRPKPGDCCVFCSFGDVLCPPRAAPLATCC